MQREGYKHSVRCKICNAKDREGNPLRAEIDEYALNAKSAEIITWLAKKGVFITPRVLENHISVHAPYIRLGRQVGSSKIQKVVVRISKKGTEVGEAIQRIIDIGDTMVKEGKMPVTEKLYVEALKEQGRRQTRTTLDAEFETLDDDFVNKLKRVTSGQSA